MLSIGHENNALAKKAFITLIYFTQVEWYQIGNYIFYIQGGLEIALYHGNLKNRMDMPFYETNHTVFIVIVAKVGAQGNSDLQVWILKSFRYYSFFFLILYIHTSWQIFTIFPQPTLNN